MYQFYIKPRRTIPIRNGMTVTAHSHNHKPTTLLLSQLCSILQQMIVDKLAKMPDNSRSRWKSAATCCCWTAPTQAQSTYFLFPMPSSNIATNLLPNSWTNISLRRISGVHLIQTDATLSFQRSRTDTVLHNITKEEDNTSHNSLPRACFCYHVTIKRHRSQDYHGYYIF
jgi:hypothetical protein